MVGKPIVGLMGTHIGFAHIRPLEGSIGVFIWILWRFSRFLTTRSLCRPTCRGFVQLSTKLFFASYSTGFKLHFWAVDRIFPTKIKKAAQEQPSPFLNYFSVQSCKIDSKLNWVICEIAIRNYRNSFYNSVSIHLRTGMVGIIIIRGDAFLVGKRLWKMSNHVFGFAF